MYQGISDVSVLWLRYGWRYIESKVSINTICIKTYILAIKSWHKIPENSVLLHVCQFIANISHIWFQPKYCGAYHVSVQSISDTICIRSMFWYRALIIFQLTIRLFGQLVYLTRGQVNIVTVASWWNIPASRAIYTE